MESEILAIGPFSKSVAKHLDYLEASYKNVKPGTKVIAHLCQCTTTGESCLLAECLGVHIHDFNSHEIDTAHLNPAELLELFPEWAEAFTALMKNNFKFYFLPNIWQKKKNYEKVNIFGEDGV